DYYCGSYRSGASFVF
nr:immunoglobulin light chain junction region [Macaca mulatta]MOW15388.1 immunoglobulin light chain junction region [Macaca mulatta]MOW16608.1 immunoglobulin light chain junction region [Macaca mulatta]MOW18013.1 immunoglobulin light chain junction region [Macaca mulatta]